MTRWIDAISPLDWPDSFPVPAPHAPRGEWVDAVRALFPGLAERLAATPQDPIHHGEGDVWTHTQMVVDALLAHSDYAALSQPARGVVFYAALLHDMAKPDTTRHQDGRIIAPGHSARGAIDARLALYQHAVPFGLREQVCRLIEVHQVPFFAFNSRRGQSPEFIARSLSCDRSLELLCLLATADMQGRISPDQKKVLDDISLFAELARELGCLDRPYPFPTPATRMAYLDSGGRRYADEPVFEEDPFQVVLLSGLPASGKSHWAAAHSDLPEVSYDRIREELRLPHGRGTGRIVHLADDRMRQMLRKKEPFLVNATHLSRQMRIRTLGLVRDYGATARIRYFEAPLEVILKRNQSRDSSLTNQKLMHMAYRWEVPGLDEAAFVDLDLQPAPAVARQPAKHPGR